MLRTLVPARLIRSLLFAVAFASLTLTAAAQSPPANRNAPHQRPPAPPVDQEQFVSYWTSETGWKSELQLRNNAAGQDLTVTPALRLPNGTETVLAPVTIKPQEVKSIDLDTAIAASAAPQLVGAYGSVVLRYRSPSSATLYAAMMIRKTGHAIAFHIDAMGESQDFQSGGREGIWWLPKDSTNDYLLLTNQGKTPIPLNLSLYDASGKERKQNVLLGPGATSRYSVRQLVQAAGLAGSYGGLKVSANAHAGSLDTLHFLFDETAGFSALLKMFDYDQGAKLEERDYAKTSIWTLRAPMLALSNPDLALAFPPGTALQPQLFLRNATAKSIDAALRFNWRTTSTTGKALGPTLRLSPYETRRIDVAALQDGKTLPKEANWASVTITTNSKPDELAAVAASYDATLRYGAQTPFSDQLAFHWVGSMWEYDPYHNSIITAGNGGTKATQAAFTIFYNQGAQKYELEQTLQPDEQMWIDVGKLIREHVPDKNGKTLPSDLTMGAYEIRDLTNKGVGTLFEGKVIYDKTYGHVAYGCAGCCGYGDPYVWYDPLGIPFSSGTSQGVDAHDMCSGGTPTDLSDTFYGSWNSANTSIATVDYYGTHSGVSIGSTTSSTSGQIQINSRPLCPIRQRNPGGGANVTPTVTFTGGNNFIFEGSDPTVTICNSEQVLGTPTQGTFSWSAATTSIRFNGSPSPYSTSSDVVTVTGDAPSSSLLDKMLTVGYSVNNQSAQTPATRTITIRLFKFLQQSGNIQVVPINGQGNPPKWGYISYVYYNIFTNPGGQQLLPGCSNISVYESVSLTNSNFPSTTVTTGTGNTSQNAQVIDTLTIKADSPLPADFSASADQYLGVGGFIVRHNTISWNQSGPSITNLGPTS